MSDFREKAGQLADNIIGFLETFYKLSVVRLADKVTRIVASILASITVLFFGTIAFIFLSVALALWVGDLLGSAALGFVVVAAFYLLLTIIVVAMRKRIVFPMIRDSIIKKLYESPEKPDQDV